MIQGIENLPTKKLMGQSMKMSLINNKTDDLWKSFMPIRKEIDGTIDSVFYSIQVY
jgi:AraC family transcriptional regulator